MAKVKPRFFSRRKFGHLPWVLYLLSGAAVAHWELWLRNKSSLLMPSLLTLGSIIVVWRARYRKEAVMLCLALYAIFSLKVVFLDGQIRIGLAVFAVAVLLMFILELVHPHEQNRDWLYEDPGINEVEDIIELKLSGKDHSENKQDH